MKGAWKPGEPRDQAQIQYKYNPTWTMTFPRFVRELLLKLKPTPTVILFNIGFWLGKNMSAHRLTADDWKEYQDAFAPLIAAGVRVVYKTVTSGIEGFNRVIINHKAEASNFFAEVFDAHHHTARWSRSHRNYLPDGIQRPEAYNELNMRMIRQLYPQVNLVNSTKPHEKGEQPAACSRKPATH